MMFYLKFLTMSFIMLLATTAWYFAIIVGVLGQLSASLFLDLYLVLLPAVCVMVLFSLNLRVFQGRSLGVLDAALLVLWGLSWRYLNIVFPLWDFAGSSFDPTDEEVGHLINIIRVGGFGFGSLFFGLFIWLDVTFDKLRSRWKTNLFKRLSTVVVVLVCCCIFDNAYGNPVTYNLFLGGWKVLGQIELSRLDSAEPAAVLSAVDGAWEGDAFPVAGGDVPVRESWDRAVNINSVVDRRNTRNSVAVCRTGIESDSEQQVMLSISADERAVFFLNGESVLDYTGSGVVVVDATSVPITLKRGQNRLEVVSYNSDGEWGMTAKLLPMSSSVKFQLHYHLDPLPPGLGSLPQAAVTYIDKDGCIITEEWVSTWRSESGRGTYEVHANPDTSPHLVKFSVAVPYLNRNDIRVFKLDEIDGIVVGRPGTGAVFGNARDAQTSQPIAGARVSVVGNDALTTQTNDAGYFLLPEVDPAYSILKVEAPGYEPRLFDYYCGYLDGHEVFMRRERDGISRR